jgi:hypothetical protein
LNQNLNTTKIIYMITSSKCSTNVAEPRARVKFVQPNWKNHDGAASKGEICATSPVKSWCDLAGKPRRSKGQREQDWVVREFLRSNCGVWAENRRIITSVQLIWWLWSPYAWCISYGLCTIAFAVHTYIYLCVCVCKKRFVKKKVNLYTRLQ